MKRRIFLVCLFYCFLGLQIYEAIAAIFWQSASYVILFESTLVFIFSVSYTAKKTNVHDNFYSETTIHTQVSLKCCCFVIGIRSNRESGACWKQFQGSSKIGRVLPWSVPEVDSTSSFNWSESLYQSNVCLHLNWLFKELISVFWRLEFLITHSDINRG